MSTGSGLGTLNTLAPLGQFAGGENPAAQPTPAATAASSNTMGSVSGAVLGALGKNTTQYVAIGLGAILIIAGLFSFKSVRETVITSSKGAAEIAA